MFTEIGYIYALSLKEDGEIRYVGQSIEPKERLWCHMADAKKNKTPIHRWCLKHGYNIQMEIVEVQPLNKLDEAEIFYIGYFRSLGFDLLNLAPGGHNLRGLKRTAEQNKKNSELRKEYFKDPKNRGKQAKATLKSFESKERRIKQSRCQGGKPIRDHLGNHYESAQEAANQLGIDSTYIRAVLTGKQLTCKGYAFAYADQPIPKLLSKEEVKEIKRIKQRDRKSPTAPRVIKDQFGNVYQSLQEVAEKFNVSRGTIRNYLKSGKPLGSTFFFAST